jgi:Arc/MetJ-type ribon-helix-helix transcriptional regulator
MSMKKSTIVIRKSGKKMGRPPLGEKAAGIFPVRLPDEIVMAIDAFAEREAIKMRSEAIRRLVELGLATAAAKTAKPAPVEPASVSKPASATKTALPKRTRPRGS